MVSDVDGTFVDPRNPNIPNNGTLVPSWRYGKGKCKSATTDAQQLRQLQAFGATTTPPHVGAVTLRPRTNTTKYQTYYPANSSSAAPPPVATPFYHDTEETDEENPFHGLS